VNLFFSRAPDTLVTIHKHAKRPGLLVYTWVESPGGWEQGAPLEVGSLEEARAAVPAGAVPVAVPETFGVEAWQGVA